MDKKVEKDHRCRNINLYLRGNRQLDLKYDIIFTQKEQEAAEKEAVSEEEEEPIEEEEPAKELVEPEKPKKKGYWV